MPKIASTALPITTATTTHSSHVSFSLCCSLNPSVLVLPNPIRPDSSTSLSSRSPLPHLPAPQPTPHIHYATSITPLGTGLALSKHHPLSLRRSFISPVSLHTYLPSSTAHHMFPPTKGRNIPIYLTSFTWSAQIHRKVARRSCTVQTRRDQRNYERNSHI